MVSFAHTSADAEFYIARLRDSRHADCALGSMRSAVITFDSLEPMPLGQRLGDDSVAFRLTSHIDADDGTARRPVTTTTDLVFIRVGRAMVEMSFGAPLTPDEELLLTRIVVDCVPA
ncbi:hypothetical protein JK358_35545 [Nocardia sp. 2]|uniref:Uncharacterized protein n=1 Tax=Nocardia acididurans TaxID=2802282 RepID=A0ABS1MHI4_9NOCA|nr:hypothetical protein [Nocardia acididurans]MBL1079729.1 hypothetical protein [Nocardia acididurans]